jgi:hypothetical protein
MERNKALMKESDFIDIFDFMVFDQKYNIKNIPQPPSNLQWQEYLNFIKNLVFNHPSLIEL